MKRVIGRGVHSAAKRQSAPHVRFVTILDGKSIEKAEGERKVLATEPLLRLRFFVHHAGFHYEFYVLEEFYVG